MNRNHTKRLKSVATHLAVVPVAPDVVQQAFEAFQETGTLPEHDRLAVAVVRRASRPYLREQGYSVVVDQALFELDQLKKRTADGTEPQPDYREHLLDEAVAEDELVRLAARIAIKALVHLGRDVTDADFVPGDLDIPDYGTVGLHLIGFPDMLAEPPYEEQAHRLFERFANIRERVDQDDREWFERLYEAIPRFRGGGILPEDELMREAVLASAEFNELIACSVGQGEAELMAAFDRVARADGGGRGAALADLSALLVRGR